MEGADAERGVDEGIRQDAAVRGAITVDERSPGDMNEARGDLRKWETSMADAGWGGR